MISLGLKQNEIQFEDKAAGCAEEAQKISPFIHPKKSWDDDEF